VQYRQTRDPRRLESINDPKLRHVVDTILANVKFESFYIVGSYARGEQRPDSDIDVLLIMKSPILVSRLSGLRRIRELRKYDLSANFFGRYALQGVANGKPSPFIPLLWRWKKYSILVAGKDLLPTPTLRVDPESYAIYACRCIRWFLNQIAVSETGFGIEPPGVRWVTKQANRMAEDTEGISGIPVSWGRAWSEIKQEASKTGPDPRVMCGALAAEMDTITQSLSFSWMHQALYVFASLISRGRVRWRTLFERVPVQTRFVEAETLLVRSASEAELDVHLVDDVARLLKDHVNVSHIRSPYLKWARLRDAVGRNIETAMMLGLEDVL